VGNQYLDAASKQLCSTQALCFTSNQHIDLQFPAFCVTQQEQRAT
jgi:hypothetical protein